MVRLVKPRWHHNGPELTSGYDPYFSPGQDGRKELPR